MKVYGKRGGFTLIELMIAVAVIGILAMLALPSYKAHVVDAKIPDAFAGLNELGSKAQQYYMDNKNYDGFFSGTGASNCNAKTQASTTNYDFGCAQGTGTGMAVQTITFTATGKGDLTGYSYTLNQAGAKTTTQPSGGTSSTSCWITKKGGSC